MKTIEMPERPYILLTPGPLTTSDEVKTTMLRDWCTWDRDYNGIVQDIRDALVRLASSAVGEFTSVLMQGSGTFSVEGTLSSAVPGDGKVLILANGAYGYRMTKICDCAGIRYTLYDAGEIARHDPVKVREIIGSDREITHIAMVHVETTTGMINEIGAIGAIAAQTGRVFIVDAMSSFGGIPLDMEEMHIDYLVSSANKCIQGVPGFGFIIARRSEIGKTRGNSRSLSLDIHDQWETMERDGGKWRYTSPTHVVRAFREALSELEKEGGVQARYRRYSENRKILVGGMRLHGFQTLLPDELQSPIITSFISPESEKFVFEKFYGNLKERGFVIYPGKVTNASTFRIGNIGDIKPDDMKRLLKAVKASMFW